MRVTSYIFLIILGLFALWYIYYYQHPDVHEPFMDLALQTFRGSSSHKDQVVKEVKESFEMIPIQCREYWLLPLKDSNVDWFVVESMTNDVQRRTGLKLVAWIRSYTADQRLKDWSWTITTYYPSMVTYQIVYDTKDHQFICIFKDKKEKPLYIFETEGEQKGRVYGQTPFLESIYLTSKGSMDGHIGEDHSDSIWTGTQKMNEVVETDTICTKRNHQPLDLIRSLLPTLEYPTESHETIPHIQWSNLLMESGIPYRWLMAEHLDPATVFLLPCLYLLLRAYTSSTI